MIILINIVIFSTVLFFILYLFAGSSRPTLINIEKTVSLEKEIFRKKIPILSNIAPLNKRLISDSMQDELNKNLFTAKVRMVAEEFFVIKEIAMIGLPLLVYSFTSNLNMIWLLACMAVGFLAPDIWLKSRIATYKGKILRALPDTIDLLSLCVSAGLDFMLAVKWVVERSQSNALIEELSLVLQEIKVGKPRRSALGDMAKRLDIPDVNSFVRTLTQADRMGTSVSETLNMISEDVRQRRFRRGERLALKAPIKMLVPLLLFIFPVVAIIIGGPIIIQFMKVKPF